jgi:microcystin degradation protein MlrC
MAEVLALARALEVPPVREISVCGGFPYAGGEHAGASVAAYVDGDAQCAAQVAGPGAADDVAEPSAGVAAVAAAKAAAQVAQALRSRAPRFDPQLLSPAEGLRRALAAPPGLVAVTDPADNPYSGGAADTPALFKALLVLRPKVPTVSPTLPMPRWWPPRTPPAKAAASPSRSGPRPPAPSAAACRWPPRAAAGAGAVHQQRPDGARPDGRSRRERRARCRRHRGPANDPAFFAAHGIDLAATRLLCVKAKNHFRAAFAERCAAIIDVDCPGPAMVDVEKLRHVIDRGDSQPDR